MNKQKKIRINLEARRLRRWKFSTLKTIWTFLGWHFTIPEITLPLNLDIRRLPNCSHTSDTCKKYWLQGTQFWCDMTAVKVIHRISTRNWLFSLRDVVTTVPTRLYHLLSWVSWYIVSLQNICQSSRCLTTEQQLSKQLLWNRCTHMLKLHRA